MSQWTHVAGIIRLNGFAPTLKRIEDAFGKTAFFESPEKDWDECTVPMGSEGSLHYQFIPGRDGSLACGEIAIWGDLRSYNDHGAVIEWVRSSMKKIELGCRGGAIQIDVEGEPERNFFYCFEKKDFVQPTPAQSAEKEGKT